jgi:hypothetical protein
MTWDLRQGSPSWSSTWSHHGLYFFLSANIMRPSQIRDRSSKFPLLSYSSDEQCLACPDKLASTQYVKLRRKKENLQITYAPHKDEDLSNQFSSIWNFEFPAFYVRWRISEISLSFALSPYPSVVRYALVMPAVNFEHQKGDRWMSARTSCCLLSWPKRTWQHHKSVLTISITVVTYVNEETHTAHNTFVSIQSSPHSL